MAIQIRRGTNAQWDANNSNIVVGEPAVTTDTGRMFIGIGSGTFKELANTDTLASEYNTVVSYTEGAIVMYQGKLYQCNTATSGTWTPADWDEITVASAINGIVSEMGDVESLLAAI